MNIMIKSILLHTIYVYFVVVFHRDFNYKFLFRYLRKRLSNIGRLKLSKFILNRTINSENTIMRIIKRACLLQAEYTRILIKELFDNEPRNIQGILLVMQNIDKQIARHIIKTSLIGKIYYLYY